jgi:hypothetical protein
LEPCVLRPEVEVLGKDVTGMSGPQIAAATLARRWVNRRNTRRTSCVSPGMLEGVGRMADTVRLRGVGGSRSILCACAVVKASAA